MSLLLTDPIGRYDEVALVRWAASLLAVAAFHIILALLVILPWRSPIETPKPPPAVYLDLPPLTNSSLSPKPPVSLPPVNPPRPAQSQPKPPLPPKQPEKAVAPPRQLLAVPQAPVVTPSVPKPAPPKPAARQPEQVPPVAPAPRITNVSEWQIAVVTVLERYKVWPPGVVRGERPSPVGLSMTIDRKGNILSYSIARSSGDPQFDAAALAMAQKARRLPPLPPQISGEIYQFVLSVEFF